MVRLNEPYDGGNSVLGRDSADSAVFDQDFRALEWQQLANSSAIKQELMRHTRTLVAVKPGDVREKVRLATNRPGGKVTSQQKADWMQRILGEEQAKPLKVSEQFVRRFNEKEEDNMERRELEKKRFKENLKKTSEIRQRNEDQRKATEAARQQRQLAARKEAARVAGLGFEDDDPLFGTGTTEAIMDESGQEEAHAEEDMEVATTNTALRGWSERGPSWDEPGAGHPKGTAAFRTSRQAPDIEFVKTRTPATGSTPSQIVYSVRVRPHIRAATAPPGLKEEGRPPSTIKRKKKKKSTTPQLSEMDQKLQRLRLEREEKRRAQIEHERYQDQVIQQWLMDKAETENTRIRHEQALKLREKRKMERDRQRIERIEAELTAAEEASMPRGDKSPEPTPLPMPTSNRLSTSQYLQRQRQLLLEDYLRKHMSLPLQARSPVLAGLEQLQPPRPPRTSSASKTRDELLSELSAVEAKAHEALGMDTLSPLPDIQPGEGASAIMD